MWKRLPLVVCFLFSVALLRAAGVKPGYTKLLIAERLDPVAMAIAPDGRIFLAEKDGRVLVVANDVLLEAPLITLEVDNHNERGLLGMTLDPHFEHNGYLYLYYTVHGAGHNRVSRFTATGNVARRDSEKIVLDLDPLPGDIHNGGSLVFGNDEKLYIAAGDGGHAPYAQVMTSLHGKI
jgi:glucose/arabinose dehydrogenase